jgi:hypothetical protein
MDETHELLLALAGRVDDDLLAWARELVAVGEDTRAVELVTAGLSADQVALPATVRAATVETARAARIDLDVDATLPPAATGDPDTEHRFTAGHEDEHVMTAVRRLPARLLDGARVRLAWRLTPAGTAPGPLPHPVLLVDVEPGGRPADVLAYQLYVGLERAGVTASIEVLTSGRPLSAYHASARREARAVVASPVAPAEVPVPVRPEPEPEPERRPEPPPETERRPEPEPECRPEPVESPAAPAFLEPPPERAPGSAPAPLPLRPAAEGSGGRRRRAAPDTASGPPRTAEQHHPTVTPITRNTLPRPVPMLRRESAPARPLTPVQPPGEATDQQQAVRPAVEGQVPALVETPPYRPMQDPLSGPLNAPLLAPLLDPTPADDADVGDEDREYDSAAFGAHDLSPLAPAVEADDGWEGEWASGDWAVSSTDIGEARPEEVAPVPVDAARHRYAEPTPAQAPPPPPAPARQPGPPQPPVAAPGPVAVPAPVPPEPAPDALPDPHHPDLGLRPDSLARLSDADRELLARLQAELGAGRKPRVTRRAGLTPNGNGRPPTMGHGA